MQLELNKDEMVKSSSEYNLETGPVSNVPATAPKKSFVVVKVFSHTTKFKHFIGQIVDGSDEDGAFEIKYLRRSTRAKK